MITLLPIDYKRFTTLRHSISRISSELRLHYCAVLLRLDVECDEAVVLPEKFQLPGDLTGKLPNAPKIFYPNLLFCNFTLNEKYILTKTLEEYC